MRPPGLLPEGGGHTSHLAQLRKCRNFGDRFTKQHREKLADLLAKTEHFVFTAIPEFSEELVASAEAMEQAGVWRTPFPVCTFEFQAEITVLGRSPHPGRADHFIAVVSQEGNEPCVHWVFVRANPHCWLNVVDSEDPASEPMIEMQIHIGGNPHHPVSIVGACLVALATHGIRREKLIGDRPVLLHRPQPRDAYTKVLIREALEWQQRGGTAVSQEGAERHNVRLHMRRGHVRHQPVGPRALGQTTQIWIEPMLVGYAEEGTVEHTHYERRPRHWPSAPTTRGGKPSQAPSEPNSTA